MKKKPTHSSIEKKAPVKRDRPNKTAGALQKIQKTVKMPETWLGAAVLFGLLFLTVRLNFAPQPLVLHQQSSAVMESVSTPLPSASAESLEPASTESSTLVATPTASVSPTATPVTTASPTPSPTVTPTPTPSPAPSPAPTPAPDLSSASIATLSGRKIKVKNGETFWIISKKYCKSHEFADQIADHNGYSDGRHLKSGDTLVLECSK